VGYTVFVYLIGAYLSFTEGRFSVNEDVGAVPVCVEISNLQAQTQTPIWADILSPQAPANAIGLFIS
jgi:hypothetical protein